VPLPSLVSLFILLTAFLLNVYGLLGDLIFSRYGGLIDIGPTAFMTNIISFAIYGGTLGFVVMRGAWRDDTVDMKLIASIGFIAFCIMNGAVLYRPLFLNEMSFPVKLSEFLSLLFCSTLTGFSIIAIIFGWSRVKIKTALKLPFEPKYRELTSRIILVFGSIVFSLIILELFARWHFADPNAWKLKNFAFNRPDLVIRGETQLDHHPVLGWVLKPNLDHQRLQTNAQRYRTNGPNSMKQLVGQTILVSGDSFANGSGVDNHQSWSAVLEGLSDVPVANAGNGGWGMDQAYLRILEDYDNLKPPLVIFAFIDGDTIRNELKIYSGAEKPYFAIEKGDLKLSNVPVPKYKPSNKNTQARDLTREIFGWSYLVYRAAIASGYQNEWTLEDWEYEYTDIDGVEIGCLLMDKLKTFEDRTGSRVVVFAQYAQIDIFPGAKNAPKILDCARDKGLFTVDTYPFLRNEYDAADDKEDFFRKYWFYPYDQHHNVEGNRVSGEILHMKIKTLVDELFSKQ